MNIRVLSRLFLKLTFHRITAPKPKPNREQEASLIAISSAVHRVIWHMTVEKGLVWVDNKGLGKWCQKSECFIRSPQFCFRYFAV